MADNFYKKNRDAKVKTTSYSSIIIPREVAYIILHDLTAFWVEWTEDMDGGSYF